jgi:L(+)-tartrate dehydratase beta subunit
MRTVRLKVPVALEDVKGLEPGTAVYLDGVIYTGREGLYHKIVDE